jgi:hypothetical protein
MINAPHLDIVAVANGVIVRPVRNGDDYNGRSEWPDTYVFRAPLEFSLFMETWAEQQAKGKKK